MSAFVVGKRHVDALVQVAVHGPRRAASSSDPWYGVRDPDTGERLTHEDADRVGAELWAENVRSVEHRYDDPEHLPGPLDFRPEDAAEYAFPAAGAPRLDAVEALKAVHCLEYQSCEHPEWEASWSARFLRELESILTRFVPGYAEADGWSVT